MVLAKGQNRYVTDFFQKSILRTAVFRMVRGIPIIKMLFMIDLMDFHAEKSFLAMPLALSDASALASLQHLEVFSLNALFLHCVRSTTAPEGQNHWQADLAFLEIIADIFTHFHSGW